MAAKALGKLASFGGSLTSEFVEFEVKRSLEWLQGLVLTDFFYLGERIESKRYASTLILRELAMSGNTALKL